MKSKGPGNSYQAASRLQNLSRIFLVSLQFSVTDKLFCLKKKKFRELIMKIFLRNLYKTFDGIITLSF